MSRSSSAVVFAIKSSNSSYVSVTATRVGGAADSVAERKSLKYASITNTHIFVPVAIETLGTICSRGLSFLVEISNRLAVISGYARETSFLFQRVSVLIQLSIRLLSGAPSSMGMTRKVNHSRYVFNLMFLTLGIYTTEGTKKIIITRRKPFFRFRRSKGNYILIPKTICRLIIQIFNSVTFRCTLLPETVTEV